MQVDGIIFDCDGTLLDSMEAWMYAEAELARRAEAELTKKDRDVIVTLTIPETGDYIHANFGLGENGADVSQMIDEIMMEFYSTQVDPRPGVVEFVKQVHAQGVKCSVASSTPQNLLQVALSQTGLASYMEAILSVDDVGVSKREPVIYERAAELMGTEKARTWVFEDAAYAVRTAHEGGFPCVGVYDQDGAGTIEELSLADVVIRSFEEIDALTFISDPQIYKIQ